ncbi:hypothetical protein [Cellulomonas uda]|uniref:hypothetical protein n=1 Tax=Cellulomonas uda TaxID=1714 RepID=UPI001141C79A|nr:hypothetical protein [Cellulomonas uda]NII65569.1 hypothetical protein [Cellulomonas uda]
MILMLLEGAGFVPRAVDDEAREAQIMSWTVGLEGMHPDAALECTRFLIRTTSGKVYKLAPGDVRRALFDVQVEAMGGPFGEKDLPQHLAIGTVWGGPDGRTGIGTEA